MYYNFGYKGAIWTKMLKVLYGGMVEGYICITMSDIKALYRRKC